VKPVRAALFLLQVLLSTLAITTALGAYRSSTVASGPAERFDLVAATQGEKILRSYGLFTIEGIPEIHELAPAMHTAGLYQGISEPVVEFGDEQFEFRAAALVSPDYFSLADLEIVAGGPFTQQDIDSGGRMVLISESAAATLFPEGTAVGSELLMLPMHIPFRITGTFRAGRASSEKPSIYLSHHPVGAEIPFSTLSVLARPGEAAAAREQLLAAARRVYETELSERELQPGQDFVISDGGSSVEERGRIRLELIIFGLFGIITLAVGSIGIFSMTVVETVERQREIGLRRALGATRLGIGLEFMLESAVLAAAGSVLGVGLTFIILPRIQPTASDLLFGGVGLAFDPLAALTAFSIVVFLGGILSLVPALQAGSLRPVEALREL
jgi:putative ABC transport system permease protein